MAVIKGGHVLPAVTLALVPTGPAPPGQTYLDSGYDLRLRAAAVSAAFAMDSAAWRPDVVTPGVGHSAVDLRKLPASEVGRCDAVAAPAYSDTLLQQSALDGNGPPGITPRPDDEAYGLPTVQRDKAPNLDPGSGGFPARRPDLVRPALKQARGTFAESIRTAPGLRSAARCDTFAAGHAAAGESGLPGVRTSGSVVRAAVDPADGRYVGTARAFAAGIETVAGTLDAVTSVVTVAATPGREPVISYRVRVTDGSVTSVLASATDVPVSLLTEQFNRSTAGIPAGLRLMGPQVTRAPDGTWTVHAPFVELRTADHTARLVAVGFSGRQPARAVGTSSAGT